MFEVFSLLIVCWGLASLLPNTADDWNRVKRYTGTTQYKLIYFVLVFILICFSGLRTVMNDTSTYLARFAGAPSSLAAIQQIDLSLGANPGFECYRILLRWMGIKNGSLFLFITAIFVSTSYVAFLRRYSPDFSFSVYLLIATTTFAFTMAAIKQTIAISIAIWAVSALLEGKRLKFILLVLLAATFHPYILIYLIAPAFLKEVWSIQAVLAVVAVIGLGGIFGDVIERLISITQAIGDQYDERFFYGSGVNTFRLLFYAVVPVLSFLYKKQLNKRNNCALNLIVNFSTISLCFMVLASFGGANIFGRMANYFDLFNCLSLPIVLCYGIPKGDGKIIKSGAIICYAVFYYTYYAKYSTAWNADYYQHISLFDLFTYAPGG